MLPVELRGPLLVLLLVVPALSIAGFRVHDAVARTNAYQHDIRLAQVDRARVLGSVLDEETGVRGFDATGDPAYLEPYNRAASLMASEAADLHADLGRLGLQAGIAVANSEQQQNAHWVARVAEPLMTARPRSAQMLASMREGKALVDRFRTTDERLQTILADAAATADANTEHAVSNVLSFVIGALIIVTTAIALFAYVQSRAARRAFEHRVRYEDQKRIADALQTAFLNRRLPTTPTLGLHAMYIPATAEAQVGGDWYDAFELPDKRILFSIGDVAGHGIEAAVVMSRARQAIIAAALHENDPGKVLARANDAILLQDSHMVTAICGYIDPATFEVVYATAGHPPPVLARPGMEPAFLPYAGMPLGIGTPQTYRTFMATAADGTLLVLYTDGVTEHRHDVIAGEARLLDATRRAMLADDPARAIAAHMFAAEPPTDDVAILTVTFHAPGGAGGPASIGARQFNPRDLPEPSRAPEVSPNATFNRPANCRRGDVAHRTF